MSAAMLFSATRPESHATRGTVAETGTIADAQLVALAREAPADALEALYSAYRGRIYSFVVRFVADPDLADDITQETFTKAYTALGTLTPEHRVLPWLYRIANNAAVDQLRRRNRFRWLRLGAVQGSTAEPEARDDHGRLGERDHLEGVLGRLPPENAAALLLHALEGYSYAEIADIQGCSMTAVRSRIARAREAVRRTYDPVEQGERQTP